MIIRTNTLILESIAETSKKHFVMQYGIAKHLGYKGSNSTLSLAMKRILDGKTEITVWHINGISEFLRYPVGYFLFGDENSTIRKIDEKAVVEKIKNQLKEEKQQKTGKTKTKFGWYVGHAGDRSSQVNTTNRILNGTTKLRIEHLQKIADFFDKPIEWLLEENTK